MSSRRRPTFSPFERVLLLLLLIWLVMPTVPLFVWSFAKGWFYPQITPRTWSLDAWRYVFSDTSQVLDSFASSLIGSTGTALLATVIGIPAGRALGLHKFRGKAIIELLLVAPVIVPSIAVVLGMHVIFIKFGLAGHSFGVMLSHLVPALPYMTVVMAGVFANYNVALEDQARSLGASRWQTWRLVMLPEIMPGIVVGAMFAFVVSWSQYILTLLIGGGKVVSVPLLLFHFATAGRNDIAGAICILYILPGIMILLVGARHMTGAATIKGFSKA